MTKPDDIPQDVWDRADDLAFYDPATEGRDGSLNRYKLREAIARAIMAAKAEEREACAGIADAELLRNRDGEVCIIDENACPSRIAAAIRNRGEAD